MEQNGSAYLDYQSPPGVNVTFYGNTPDTIGQTSSCGFAGIENLLPLQIQQIGTIGFTIVDKYLSYMGYQTGLSMFALPYDFRKTTVANELAYTLQRTIELAYNLTGKKVILAAHSMGNYGSLYALNNFNQSQKDTMILTYLQMAPPLLGAAKAVKVVIGGDDEFYQQLFNYTMGLNFDDQKAFLGSSSAFYDILPKPVFFYESSSQWLIDVIDRIQIESDYISNNSLGLPNLTYSWFPAANETCFNNFTSRPNYCLMAIQNWQTVPILQIGNQTFFARYNDTIAYLANFSTFTNNSQQLLESDYLNNIQNLTNPGVPVITIYGTTAPTDETIYYQENPALTTIDNEFMQPTNDSETYGDGTVPSTSSLLPALKWAWQFDNYNASENAEGNEDEEGITYYPVKVLEWCSLLNEGQSVYDEINNKTINNFTQNAYIGLNCSCQAPQGQMSNSTNCIHATMMVDQYFIYFLADLVKSNDYVGNNTENISGLKISNTNLQNLMNECPGLTYPRDVLDVEDLLANFI